MRIRKAVFPAAGLGTRFLPATKAQPKEMLPIVDKPTIQYVVEEAVASGITDVIIVTGRGKSAIEDHFDRSFELELVLSKKGKHDLLEEVRRLSELVSICYIRQKEPLGLGHAVLVARNLVGDEPFAVLLGDNLIDSNVPCLKQLMAVYGLEFQGKRYDAGSKLGFLKATVEYALKRPDIAPKFKEYLRGLDLDGFSP